MRVILPVREAPSAVAPLQRDTSVVTLLHRFAMTPDDLTQSMADSTLPAL